LKAKLGDKMHNYSRRIELLTEFDIESDRGFYENIEKMKNRK